MKRINVIGTSGSGKSTFSRLLANKLKYPYLEMDAIFWKPNWQESTDKNSLPTLRRVLVAKNGYLMVTIIGQPKLNGVELIPSFGWIIHFQGLYTKQ